MNSKYAEILLLLQTTKNLPLAIVAALKSIEDDLAARIPKAIIGDQGMEGPMGISGNDGPQGNDGPEGPQGPAGPRGAEGPAGREGREGMRGQAGIDGLNGKPGKDGMMGPKGPAGKDGKPGKDGLPGRDGSPDSGIEIIHKINRVPDESLVKIMGSKVFGMSTIVQGLGGGGGASSSSSAGNGFTYNNETPTGTVNGDGMGTGNVTFILANTPTTPTGLMLYGSGGFASTWLYIQGVDYTITGKTITMTQAPLTGTILRAYYP